MLVAAAGCAPGKDSEILDAAEITPVAKSPAVVPLAFRDRMDFFDSNSNGVQHPPDYDSAGDEHATQRETVFAAADEDDALSSTDVGMAPRRSLPEWEEYEKQRAATADSFSRFVDKLEEELRARVARRQHENMTLSAALERISNAHRAYTNACGGAFVKLRTLSAVYDPTCPVGGAAGVLRRASTRTGFAKTFGGRKGSDRRSVGFSGVDGAAELSAGGSGGSGGGGSATRSAFSGGDSTRQTGTGKGVNFSSVGSPPASGSHTPLTPFTPFTPAPLEQPSGLEVSYDDNGRGGDGAFQSPTKPSAAPGGGARVTDDRWGKAQLRSEPPRLKASAAAAAAAAIASEEDASGEKLASAATSPSAKLDTLSRLRAAGSSLSAGDMGITAFVEALTVRNATLALYVDTIREGVQQQLQDAGKMSDQSVRAPLRAIAEAQRMLRADAAKTARCWQAFRAALIAEGGGGDIADGGAAAAGAAAGGPPSTSAGAGGAAFFAASPGRDKWLTQKMYGDAAGEARANRSRALLSIITALRSFVEVEQWKTSTVNEILAKWSAQTSLRDEVASATVADLHALLRIAVAPEAAVREHEADPVVPKAGGMTPFPRGAAGEPADDGAAKRRLPAATDVSVTLGTPSNDAAAEGAGATTPAAADSPRWIPDSTSFTRSATTPAFFADRPLPRSATAAGGGGRSPATSASRAAELIGVRKSPGAAAVVGELTGMLPNGEAAPHVAVDPFFAAAADLMHEERADRADRAERAEAEDEDGAEPPLPDAPVRARTLRCLKTLPGTVPLGVPAAPGAETSFDWKLEVAISLREKVEKQRQRHVAFERLSEWLREVPSGPPAGPPSSPRSDESGRRSSGDGGAPPKLGLPAVDSAVAELSQELPPLYDVPAHAVSAERYVGAESLLSPAAALLGGAATGAAAGVSGGSPADWVPTALIISPQGNLHVMALNPEDGDSLEPEPPLLSLPLPLCEVAVYDHRYCVLQSREGAAAEAHAGAGNPLRSVAVALRRALEKPRRVVLRFADSQDAADWQARVAAGAAALYDGVDVAEFAAPPGSPARAAGRASPTAAAAAGRNFLKYLTASGRH